MYLLSPNLKNIPNYTNMLPVLKKIDCSYSNGSYMGFLWQMDLTGLHIILKCSNRHLKAGKYSGILPIKTSMSHRVA